MGDGRREALLFLTRELGGVIFINDNGGVFSIRQGGRRRGTNIRESGGAPLCPHPVSERTLASSRYCVRFKEYSLIKINRDLLYSEIQGCSTL